MNKFKALDKGEYLYINKRKNKLILLSVLSVMTVLIIFLTGVIIYHTNKTIFSVIAAVAALPAAKLITLLAVIFPYKSGDLQLYNELTSLKNEKNAVLVCDLAISSSSKVSFIQFAYILDEKVFLFSDYKKLNISFAEKYIKDILNQNCNVSSVKIYNNSDKFISTIKAQKAIEESNMDTRIGQKLISYAV